MSKKVTIPNDGMKPFVVMHNGEKYVYAPGETIDVPDGVALEIEEYKRKKLHGEAIPPFGVGGGSGGASSWNDLEDKPFYEYTENVVIAEDSTARNIMPHIKSTVEGYSKNGYLRGDTIIPGETYVVTFDGVDYVGVAQKGATYTAILGGWDGRSDYSQAPLNIVVLPENEVMLTYS